MAWLRIDDRFPEHPKVLRVGPLGLAVHVRALCYCARNLTDGYIPIDSVSTFVSDLRGILRKSVPDSLVNAGIWEPIEGGYLIHDYLDYNPSREQVRAERKATAERVVTWRKRHRNTDVTPLQDDVKRKCNAPPVSPTPTPKKKRENLRFSPPSVADVGAYLLEIGATFSAQRFVDHHIGNGWTCGKAHHPVKDWRAVARTWKANDDERAAAPRNGRPAPALVGAHKAQPETRDVGDAPEEIREIHRKLRRREASDDEVARLEAWVHGGTH